MTSFRPFFNAATGEWVEYTAIAQDSDGKLVRFNWRSVPGGVVTEHVHPRQEERFIVTSGEAHFTLNGEARVARAGETVIVPAGARHSEGNAGPADVVGYYDEIPGILRIAGHSRIAQTAGSAAGGGPAGSGG